MFSRKLIIINCIVNYLVLCVCVILNGYLRLEEEKIHLVMRVINSCCSQFCISSIHFDIIQLKNAIYSILIINAGHLCVTFVAPLQHILPSFFFCTKSIYKILLVLLCLPFLCNYCAKNEM